MSISIPIFLASDNAYAPFVASTIASICDNTKAFIEFYILDGGISEKNREKILKLKDVFQNFSIEFCDVRLPETLEYKNMAPHISVATYNRFLIPIVKPEIKRAIYLDVDLVVLGDITDLWKVSLCEHTLGWVRDFNNPYLVADFVKNFELLNYYNAGVLLIDLERWKKQDYTKRVFQLEQKVRDKIKFADQDLMNILFAEDSIALNPKFNCQFGGNNPVVRHFIGIYKPWQRDTMLILRKEMPLPNFDDFWKYMKMTEFYSQIKRQFPQKMIK